MNLCPQCRTEYDNHVLICPRDGTVLEAERPTDPLLGQTLEGKYRLDSQIGQGGMGTVYRATHLMLGKTVAVKVVNPALVGSTEVVRRFQREARAASSLIHPNIAAAYDLGQTPDGTLFIAMEFVQGESLKAIIRQSGRLDATRITAVLKQVTSALSLAHSQQIIHRDLKPQNIMVAADRSGRDVAKLLDFGIAKTFDDGTQLTTTGVVIGTPHYMSPEQISGEPIDARSDLYSLGVIMFEMLVGEVPFDAPTTTAVLIKHLNELPQRPSHRLPAAGIPPALEAIAMRCLEKRRDDRFQSADELLLALEGAETSTPSRPRPVTQAATEILPPPAKIVTKPTPVPEAKKAAVANLPTTLDSPKGTILDSSESEILTSTSGQLPRRRWRAVGLATVIVAAVGGFVFYTSGNDDRSNVIRPTDGQEVPKLPSGPAPARASAAEASPLSLERAQELERLAAASPNDPAARLALANLYYDAQRFDLAAPAYESVLKLNPKDVGASTDLAVCYYSVGQIDRALRQIDTSLRIDPKHLPTILNQGIIRAFGKSDLAGAAASWRKVIAIAPQSPEAQRAQQGLDAISGAGRGSGSPTRGRDGDQQ